MMKAYKLEVLVIDFDNIGEEGIVNAVHNTKYPNHCISPKITELEYVDIGEWDDSHPLNNNETYYTEYKRLFKGCE